MPTVKHLPGKRKAIDSIAIGEVEFSMEKRRADFSFHVKSGITSQTPHLVQDRVTSKQPCYFGVEVDK